MEKKIRGAKEASEDFELLSPEEKLGASEAADSVGVQQTPYEKLSLELFVTAVILNTIILAFLYGVLLPLPSPVAHNLTTNATSTNSSKIDFVSELIGSWNSLSGTIKTTAYERIIFSFLMLSSFIILRRRIETQAPRTYLVYIFLFTCMVASAGPLGIIALIFGLGGLVGALGGGLFGGIIAFGILWERGFVG